MIDARALVAEYLKGMAERRATGAASKETTYYTPFENLLNGIGRTLKPKVLCAGQLAGVGGSKPDFGLFAQSQLQHGVPRPGALPERGVIEAKAPYDEVAATAGSAQVKKYLDHYGLVLVTNYRAFLVERGPDGVAVEREGFVIADTEGAFWKLCVKPEAAAETHGTPLVEYLTRALAYQATLTAPQDLAWLLASYAPQALAQVEGQPGLPALKQVKKALEEGLGIAFEAGKGSISTRMRPTVVCGALRRSSWRIFTSPALHSFSSVRVRFEAARPVSSASSATDCSLRSRMTASRARFSGVRRRVSASTESKLARASAGAGRSPRATARICAPSALWPMILCSVMHRSLSPRSRPSPRPAPPPRRQHPLTWAV